MSYDNTRTIKQKRVGNIEISIEGGVYYPYGDGYSSWDYWVEVIKWNSDTGITIEQSENFRECDIETELENIFQRLCKKYFKEEE